MINKNYKKNNFVIVTKKILNTFKIFTLAILTITTITHCGSSASTTTTSQTTSTGPTSVGNSSGNGQILYSLGNTFYIVNGLSGATPVNMNTLFNSAGAGTGEEDKMGISRNGDYLVVSTTRLGCSGYACLARFNVDGTSGEKITVGAAGDDLHVYSTQPAISPDGATVVFTQQNDDSSIDLFATTRTGGVWGTLVNLTTSSAYTYNTNPTISADGTKVAFVCSNVLTEDTGNNICEVDIDGTDYGALIIAGTSNTFTNVFRPSYANNGDLYFEGVNPTGSTGQDGERIWVLAAARTSAAVPAGDFLNAVSPCAIPNGNLAILWLGRAGTSGVHELTLLDSDDALSATLVTEDVDDVGISCSE